MFTLDRNYNVIAPQAENEAITYTDGLGDQVDRILKLKERGKIDDRTADALIKKVFELYIDEEIHENVSSLISPKPKKNKMLFLRYFNEELYA